MHSYQQQFIELALSCDALRFGEFELKSGRISPYFFNAGLFNTGQALALMGECYAQAIIQHSIDYDGVFGPAYKGIPLVSSVAVALYKLHGSNVAYTYNRKEAKHHGEGGSLVGSPLKDKVLIVDDVITAGTAIRQSMQIITAENATCAGVIVALDRQEKGLKEGLKEGMGEKSAIQEINDTYSMHVVSIITLDDLIEFLQASEKHDKPLNAMQAYRDKYGV